jgi:hypothetical protein
VSNAGRETGGDEGRLRPSLRVRRIAAVVVAAVAVVVATVTAFAGQPLVAILTVIVALSIEFTVHLVTHDFLDLLGRVEEWVTTTWGRQRSGRAEATIRRLMREWHIVRAHHEDRAAAAAYLAARGVDAFTTFLTACLTGLVGVGVVSGALLLDVPAIGFHLEPAIARWIATLLVVAVAIPLTVALRRGADASLHALRTLDGPPYGRFLIYTTHVSRQISQLASAAPAMDAQVQRFQREIDGAVSTELEALERDP